MSLKDIFLKPPSTPQEDVQAANVCPGCGSELSEEDRFCKQCGTKINIKKESRIIGKQNPTSAGILSLLLVGLGQIYNDQVWKGIGLFILAVILTSISPILGLFAWIYAIYDAYTAAVKINRIGIAESKPAGVGLAIFKIPGWVIIGIVIVMWLIMPLGTVIWLLGGYDDTETGKNYYSQPTITTTVTTQPKPTVTTTVTTQPKPTVTTTVTTQPKNTVIKIKQDIRLVLGTNTNRGVKKIRSIDVLKYEGSSGERILVNVNYNADDNLWTSYIRRGIWMDDIKVFKKLYSTYPKITKASMMAYFPLTDPYGNAKDVLVSNIVLDKKTAEKINWDNFITDNLPRIADKIEEHPVLKT